MAVRELCHLIYFDEELHELSEIKNTQGRIKEIKKEPRLLAKQRKLIVIRLLLVELMLEVDRKT